MTVIIEDKRIRIIKLTGDELILLLDGIKSSFSYDSYKWYEPIINKLKEAIKQGEKGK